MYKSFSRSGSNYSFFHRYFKSLYPSLYEDMMQNMGAVDPKPVPLPSPTEGIERSVEREERSAEEIAAANKLRIQDRIDGKTTINGMVVGGIPEFQAGTTGVSPTVHKLLTGFSTKKNPMATAGLGMFDEMNEKSHQVNIDALIESEGKSGGAGMLYDPISNTFHGVTLSVKDISEGTSNFITKLTGSSTGKRRTFVGKVPDTAVYKGKVYNTLDAKDYLALMDAMEAEAKNVYDNHLKITKPTTDENQVDLTASDVRPIVSSEQILREGEDQQTGVTVSGTGGDPLIPELNVPSVEAAEAQAQADEEEKQKNREEAAKQYETPDDKGIADLYEDVDDFSYNTGGFIGGMNPDQVTDAQTVADDYPIDSDDGDFMINAAAIEKDPQRFNEIISAGIQKAREKGIEVGDISGVGMDESGDVLASKGEFLVKKPLAETIGYDTLNQFNDQGKPEVDRRVAASGGFLDGYSNGGELGYDTVSEDFYNKIKQFSKKKAKRSEIDSFIDGLTDTEALSILFLTETEAGKDPLIHMQRIGDVVLNRVKSNSPDFKNTNTIKDVLKQRSSRGTGSKMYQFDGLEPTTLQERLLDVTERGMKNALNKTFTAAINTLDTDPDLETSRLPDNILFYKKRTPQNEGDFMDSSKFLAPLYDFGEHTFYGYFPTEEYP